jgi:hypothetical protein
VNLPDPKRRVRHVVTAFAVLILVVLCLTVSFRWAFFLVIPLWLMEPAWHPHLKPKQVRHFVAIAAVLVLAALCLIHDWPWAFFLAALLNLTEPAWRAQLFRPAGSLAGFFVFASLMIFAVPLGCLYWAFTQGKAFDLAMPSVLMEAIFVATIGLGGFLLHRKTKRLLPQAQHAHQKKFR